MNKNLFVDQEHCTAIDLSHIVVMFDMADESGFLVLVEGHEEPIYLTSTGQACFDALVAYWEVL